MLVEESVDSMWMENAHQRFVQSLSTPFCKIMVKGKKKYAATRLCCSNLKWGLTVEVCAQQRQWARNCLEILWETIKKRSEGSLHLRAV